MTIRSATAMVTLVSFALVVPAQDVRAATAAGPAHSVTRTALHQAVQSSHTQAVEARTLVNQFMARPEVQKQLKRIGVAPDRLMAKVATLSDDEIARLQQQVMAADLQAAPAGLSSGAIVAIVLVSVGAAVAILLIAYYATDEYYVYR